MGAGRGFSGRQVLATLLFECMPGDKAIVVEALVINFGAAKSVGVVVVYSDFNIGAFYFRLEFGFVWVE